ncbi:MAG: hypothetical protein AAF196_20030 [Planctomycetota bacterium]
MTVSDQGYSADGRSVLAELWLGVALVGFGLFGLGCAQVPGSDGTEDFAGPLALESGVAEASFEPISIPVPGPVEVSGTAYELAGSDRLPERRAIELEGLHNVFQLSDSILSGAEPEGREAFEQLAEMGVRTILSVDGKEPEVQTAAEFGIRYVHMPIRYRGLTDEERLAIAKTFRELEAPFYVHCFHGRHRGPAAAAVGRVVRDGATREQAVAEMRQYCGTSEKYEGLYAAIAFGELPGVDETSAYDYDFAPRRRFDGLRPAMVDLARSSDVVKALARREWKPAEDHPDANARNEAAKMADLFAGLLEMQEVKDRPEDFRGWMSESQRLAAELNDALRRFEDGEAAASDEAKSLAGELRAVCTDCHVEYRNQ